MGDIVYKTLVKFGILLLVLWLSKDYFDEKYFWIVSSLSIFFFVINPAYISYKKFIEKTENITSGTLCASCKHFDKSAVLCIKYDKHPTEDSIPCEGSDWEPK